MSRLSEVFPEGFTVEDDPLAIGGGHPAATADPLAVPMVSGFGKYASDKEGTRPDALAVIDFHKVRELVDNPQAGVEKDHAQWLIPSTHKSRKGHDKNGTRPAIWADIDEPGPRTIQQTHDKLRDLLADCDYEVYASRSATKEKQKCRILVPLAGALTPPQWLIVSEAFRDKLALAGIETDKASEGLGQVLYLPNRGEFYDKARRRGFGLLQPLVAWRQDIRKRQEQIEHQAEATRKAQDAARQRREALAASRTVSGFRSPIEAFNAAYDVAEILARNGYEQRGNTFRHPASESGSFSATVRESAPGVRRVHSLSTSDLLYTDGHGAHDAFSAFCILEHGGDRDAAIRDAGDRWLTIGGESFNKVQRREWAQQQQNVERVFPSFDQETGEMVEQIENPLDRHPLAQFVAYDTTPRAVRWIIPGVVEHGVVTISGARGVGKTTCILPLAMTAAGLHGPGDPLAPKADRWRHVIYIVEHVEQAQRIVAGMVEHGGLGIRAEDVRERLHIVEARRLDPAYVAQVGKLYAERFKRTVTGVDLLPLVVIDTKAAVLALENENDNSEGSRAVYALKQGFSGLPTWIIGHIAKAKFGRTDVAALSDRGAGSFEADAIQNAYLVQEGDARYLLLGKRRFEPRWPELLVASHMAEVTAYDEWGDPETTTLRWGIVTPPDMSRHEARQKAQEAAKLERRGDMRQSILDAVQVAYQSGNPLSKNGVKGTVRGFGSPDVAQEIEALMGEGWLHEIEVPSKQRINNAKARFLVKLDTPEHDEWMRSGIVPATKLAIPQSWKKPEIPLGPESQADSAKNTP